MKKFKVTYITYDGDLITREIKGYSQQSATNKLVNCKQIYSCELILEKEEATDEKK